jgi:hypothetical protein
MTKDQEDKLNMYQATDGVLQTNNGVWTANTGFAGVVSTLEGKIDDIEDLRDQQEEDTTGVTEDKQEAREDLEKNTYKVGSILGIYASVSGNRKLFKKVNYGKSELLKARDNELPGMSGQVHEEAVANALAAAAYGLTSGMITTLQSSLTAYVSNISKPREAITETSAATEQLPPVFTDIDKILEEQLDKGMELYHESNPDFYTDYFNARIIVNSPTLKRALQVKFLLVDKDKNLIGPVERMKVVIDGTVHRRSTKLGNIYVQNLTEGAHVLEAELPGYNKATVNFNVINGETTKLTVKWMDNADDPTGSRGGRAVVN